MKSDFAQMALYPEHRRARAELDSFKSNIFTLIFYKC